MKGAEPPGAPVVVRTRSRSAIESVRADPGSQASSRPPRAWQELLSGSSPREVLARIVEGDPLSLRGVVAERLRARSYLLDGDRVHLRALARTARDAGEYRGCPDLDEWLGAVVDDALVDLLREDAEMERAGVAPSRELLGSYEALASPLGLDPLVMRAACVVFNHLPDSNRAAFFLLVIDGLAVEEASKRAGVSVNEIARRARRALEAMLADLSSQGEESAP